MADGDLAELAISLVLDRMAIKLLNSFDLWSAKFLGALFKFRDKSGFLGSSVQEMRLSQALDPRLLQPMCLAGIKHTG